MPSIRTQFTWLLAFCLIFAQLPCAYADGPSADAPSPPAELSSAVGLERFAHSGDIEFSEDGRRGITVAFVEEPATVQAGEPVTVAILIIGGLLTVGNLVTTHMAFESSMDLAVKRVEKGQEYDSPESVQAGLEAEFEKVLAKYQWLPGKFLSPDQPKNEAKKLAADLAPLIYMQKQMAKLPPDVANALVGAASTEIKQGVNSEIVADKFIKKVGKELIKSGAQKVMTDAMAAEFGKKYAKTVGKVLLGSTGKFLGQKLSQYTGQQVFAKAAGVVTKGVLTALFAALDAYEIWKNVETINANKATIAALEGVPSPVPTPTPTPSVGLQLVIQPPTGQIVVNNPSNLPSGSTGGGSGGGSGGGGSADLIVNGNFASGLTGWQATGSAPVMSSFGPILPPPGSNGQFAAVNTGLGDASGRGTLVQVFNVPTSRQASLEVIYNFVTNEFPDYYGSVFNDAYRITFSGPGGTLAFQHLSLNQNPQAAYTPVNGLPTNLLDHSTGGQLGWQGFGQQNLALSPGTYTLRIEVEDVTDQIFDSAMLVDRASLR